MRQEQPPSRSLGDAWVIAPPPRPVPPDPPLPAATVDDPPLPSGGAGPPAPSPAASISVEPAWPPVPMLGPLSMGPAASRPASRPAPAPADPAAPPESTGGSTPASLPTTVPVQASGPGGVIDVLSMQEGAAVP